MSAIPSKPTFHAMKPVRSVLYGAALAALSSTAAQAEVLMQFSTGAAYLQTGPFTVDFAGGDLNVNTRDGNAIISDCFGFIQGFPFIIPPGPGCPLGTTGYIAEGDINGDGIRDAGGFWSISEVIPAFVIEPFRPDKVALVAAPPSDLGPRPLGGFSDQGAVIFYNVLTDDVVQFDVSWYDLVRVYPAGPGGRALMKDEVVLGQYVFTYPLLNAPDTAPPVAIPVTYAKMPEGVDPAGREFVEREQFRYTNLNWDGNGSLLFDPRITNYLTWQGNNGGNTIQNIDQLRLSFLDPTTVGVEGVEEVILFPPSQTPLLIPDPLTQEYIIPPFFFQVGDEALLRLRFDRLLGSNAVAFDTSVRLFEVNVRFIDTYAGFKLVAFPIGATEQQRAASFDFDGDGQSNAYEFGLQTDPADDTSFSPDPVPQVNFDNTLSFELTKRPNASIKYSFSVSENGGPFVLVNGSNPDWFIEIDDDTTLRVTSVSNALNPLDVEARITVVPVNLGGI